MNKSLYQLAKPTLIVLAIGVAAGCATKSPELENAQNTANQARDAATDAQNSAEQAMSAANRAQQTADDARNMAGEALQAAQRAQQTADQNSAAIQQLNEKIDRMFKKSMNK